LIEYHNAEGNLIFEGGNIAYSLVKRNQTKLLHSILHADFIQNIDNNGLSIENLGHQITQGLPLKIPIIGGLGSPSVDLITQFNGSEIVSMYKGYSAGAIVSFSGSKYKKLGAVVYFSFSIDGINDSKKRALLIRNSVEYVISPKMEVKLSDYALRVNTSEVIQVSVEDAATSSPIKNAKVLFGYA